MERRHSMIFAALTALGSTRNRANADSLTSGREDCALYVYDWCLLADNLVLILLTTSANNVTPRHGLEGSTDVGYG